MRSTPDALSIAERNHAIGVGSRTRLRAMIPGLAIATLAALAVCGTAVHAQDAARHDVEIESQPIGGALKALAAQTGLQVLVFSQDAGNKQSPAVHGSLMNEEALLEILANSGLTYEKIDDNTVVIRKVAAAAPTAATHSKDYDLSAGALRVAHADTTQSAPRGASTSQQTTSSSAADAADSRADLQEVVVTATKRTQNVQDVPIAISAFSAKMLQQKGITDVTALSRLAPNVNLDAGSPFSGSSSVLSASIRGIGQDDFAFNLDPGVGVYLDGVYLARTVGANQNLLDVERVEILKGPQGTLFGRNTIGGAISIVTRTPGDHFVVDGQITTGSYHRLDVSLLTDIPLSDTVRTTFTFSSLARNGFEERIPYHSPVPYVSDPDGVFHASGNETFDTQGGQNQQTARAKFLWLASDAVTATATFDWTHTNQPAYASTVIRTAGQFSDPGAALGAIYNACIQGIMFAPTAPLVCGPRGVVGTSLWNANANPATYRLIYGPADAITGDIDKTYATGPNFDKLDSYGTAAIIDWKLNDSVSLKSITGWRELHWESDLDQDGSPLAILQSSFAEGQRQISEELQLIGKAFDSRLSYVGGLYFFEESGFIHDYVTFPEGLLQIDGPNSLRTDSDAAYFHLDYQLTDAVGLTFGGRYSQDRKQFRGGQQDLNDFNYKISGCYPPQASAALIGGPANLTCQQALYFPNPANPEQLYPVGQNHLSFNEFTPTAGVQYHINPDMMAYLSYSKGFKTGGWTTRLQNPIPPATPGGPLPSAPTFNPETDNSYEAGLKSEWLDHHLIANVAMFLSKYDGIQLNYQISTTPITQNAGNATIKGTELELQSRMGKHFVLNANLGFMDAYYTFVAPQAQASTGAALPKTPRWKYDLSPEVHFALPNGALLRFDVDYTYTSKSYNDVQNTEEIARKAAGVVNMSTSLSSPDDKISLTLGGTNVGNSRYLTTGQPQAAGGTVYGTYNAPPEWYATLSIKY